jgi:hypothetical protein
MNLDEYDEVKRTKIMVYGEPKAGKTALVGKLAEAGFKLHWFDLENGVKTLRNEEMLAKEFRKNVSVYNIPDHKDLPIGLDALRKLFKGGKRKYCYLHGVDQCPLCKKTPGLKWSDEIDINEFTDNDILVIDSWTQVSQSAYNKVVAASVRKDEEYKATFDDWRMQGSYLDEVLSKIQVSNINICVISHEMDVEKSESKEKIVPLGGTRNFSKSVGKYFDEVIYCSRGNKKHSAYSSSTWNNTHLTGGRSGVKLEDGKEVSLADIFRAGNTKEK